MAQTDLLAHFPKVASAPARDSNRSTRGSWRVADGAGEGGADGQGDGRGRGRAKVGEKVNQAGRAAHEARHAPQQGVQGGHVPRPVAPTAGSGSQVSGRPGLREFATVAGRVPAAKWARVAMRTCDTDDALRTPRVSAAR